MLNLFSESAVSLLKTYGIHNVPETVKTFAEKMCMSDQVLALPHLSTDEPPCYAVICPTFANEGSRVHLFDAEGNMIRGDEADALIAEFADFVEERIRERLRKRHIQRTLGAITLALLVLGLGVAFIAWVLKTDPRPILTHPVVFSLLCVGTLLLYAMPWFTLSEARITELLEMEPEHGEIIWLQSMHPDDPVNILARRTAG